MAHQRGDEQVAVGRRRTGNSTWIWIVGTLAIIGIALFLLIPLFNERESAGVETGASISEITGNPAQYYGKNVTVSGQVDRLVGDRAFVIGGQEFIGGNELLVVSNSQLPPVADRPDASSLAADDIVQVSGLVEEFSLANIEKDIGTDLDDALFADYAGRPVVVARSLDLSPRVVDGEAPQSVIADRNVTVAEIVSNAGGYMGQNVLVRGDVNSVVGPHAFTIDESSFFTGGIDNDLLVISPNQIFPINEGFGEANVQVQGAVRQFNLAEIENEIGFDLDDTTLADWNGRTVLVANSIQAAQGRLSVEAQAGMGTDRANAPVLADANVTVADIAGNTAAFVGKNVLIRSEVESVIGPNAFSLDEDALLTGGIDNDVLVVSAQEGLPLINESLGEANVQVQGTVRQFNLAEIENELGYDLDDNLFTDWDGHPVIVATSIQAARGALPASAIAPEEGGAPAAPANAAGAAATAAQEEGNVTVAEIASNVGSFTGQMVMVNGEVNSLISPNAFTLDEDAPLAGGIDSDVLVIGANQQVPFNEGLGEATVRVEGTVRQFNLAEIENELGYDLDDNLFADWDGRPTIVATNVTRLEAITPPAEAGITGDVLNVTVAEITGNPGNYVGQNVAVNEEIEEVLGGDAFTLDEDALLAGGIDNDLLVIRGMQNMPAFGADIEGESVVVVGPVREFNLTEIEKEIGFDLDDNMFADWSGRPVVVAKALGSVR